MRPFPGPIRLLAATTALLAGCAGVETGPDAAAAPDAGAIAVTRGPGGRAGELTRVSIFPSGEVRVETGRDEASLVLRRTDRVPLGAHDELRRLLDAALFRAIPPRYRCPSAIASDPATVTISAGDHAVEFDDGCPPLGLRSFLDRWTALLAPLGIR
jgi:hypothetical protein